MSVFALLGITLVTFILLNVIPSDPILVMIGQETESEIVERLRAELGMDRPLAVQYISFVRNG